MTQFFNDIGTNPFLLTGLAAGLLASLACGIIGPYVVTRRIVFLAGAIAHMAVGGLGAAIFLNHHYPEAFAFLRPLHGAMIVALGSAVLIGLVHDRAAERLDTLIGAMWAVGMSIGILLIKFTPGYHTELMSYLFGNIVYVPAADLWLFLVLDAVIVATAVLLHKRLLAICLDPQQAELQGINVLWMNIALLSLVALAVISLIQVVGLILVLALLTLPAATAAHHVARLAPMMFVATGICVLVTTVPRIAVYGSDVSPEPAIVLSSAGVYLASVLIHRRRSRARSRQTRQAAPTPAAQAP